MIRNLNKLSNKQSSNTNKENTIVPSKSDDSNSKLKLLKKPSFPRRLDNKISSDRLTDMNNE